MLINDHTGYQALYERLRQFGSLAVAFSGGVDSTFLLKAASDALAGKVLALTVSAPYIPQWEIKEASELASMMQVPHLIIPVEILPALSNNPPERCYICKKALFGRLIEEAQKQGYQHIADGTNADDVYDFRPGRKALKELNVHSPLLEAGLGKEEIRKLSAILGLPTAGKPAYACLLTRIPHNTRVTEDALRIIEEAERYLHSAGFPDVRVRHHGDIARIEVPQHIMPRLVSSAQLAKITAHLKYLGYRYVTLDLEGYRKPVPPEQKT